MKLTIGSRGSQLALWQARWVAARLAMLGIETSIEVIRTTGDRITGVPLARAGAKGLFTKEIEEALLDGRIDLAVHSLKDLPTVLPSGLALAAIPERESPFDALVGATLDQLSAGARVGTSSLRRAAQLRRLRPGLVIEDVRGNLDTRLRKLDEGQYDAILLAAAGLRRLGFQARIAEILTPGALCPAAGQGALAIETRTAPDPAFALCAQLDHAPTRIAVTAERALLAALGGGCQVPIGAHATLEGGELHLRSVVAGTSGEELFSDSRSGPASDPEALGVAAAQALCDSGASRIISAIAHPDAPLRGVRVLVTRARSQAGPLSARLSALGADILELPVIEFVPLDFPLPDWPSYRWAIFTSSNGVEFFFRRLAPSPGPRLCAIGPATAAALRARGLEPDAVPDEFVAESLVAALSSEPLSGARILLPRAEHARDVIPAQLSILGAHVDILPVYRTLVPADLPAQARALFAGARPGWITFTSSSTVRHFLAAVPKELLSGVRIASIGPVTSETARSHGLQVTVEASPSTTEALADAIAAWVSDGPRRT